MQTHNLEITFRNIMLDLEKTKHVQSPKDMYESFYKALADTQKAILECLKSKLDRLQ